MKKFCGKLLTATILLGAMVGLTACGSGSSDNSEGSGTITYSIWDKNQLAGMKAIAGEFMKENPEIKVSVEAAPWDQYWTKLEAGATGDNMPDVFWMHGAEAERYMKNDTLMDLTNLIKDSEEIHMDRYPAGIADLYTYDGKNYGIPKDVDTIGLWYNKTLFDEKGLPYPDETWDWAKLKEVAAQLTDPEKGVYGYGAPNDAQQGFEVAIRQNGGDLLNEAKDQSMLATPATQEALQWWIDFSLKDKTSPTNDQFSENNNVSYFSSGKLAMCNWGSWMLADFLDNEYIAENCDVTYLPKGKVQATIYNGLSNAVSANTKNKNASLKFVEFLGSKKAMEIQGAHGSAIPADEEARQAWIDKTSSTFNTKVFIDMLDYGVINQSGPNYQKGVNYRNQVFSTDLFSGKESVETVTEKVDKEINKILQED